MTVSGSRVRSWRVVPFLVVFAVTLVMLFSPGSTVPSGPPNSDKVTHLLMFVALVVAARFAGFRTRWVLLGALVYAAVSEVLQAILPIQRSGSLWDWAADAVGVIVGLGLVAAWRVKNTTSAAVD
ncbi:VanZ family protein [Rhodococcus gannanensis]|jgi:VanZ family protein|uniref:VanZ family protein n=1 Tax=Rhodococcus gannanensis TaxID=1960308 RepID=A0ABW4P8B4_9NOCA